VSDNYSKAYHRCVYVCVCMCVCVQWCSDCARVERALDSLADELQLMTCRVDIDTGEGFMEVANEASE
jgi:hypothetical protein